MNAILASGPFVALGWLLVVLVCIFIIKLIWKPVTLAVLSILMGILGGLGWIETKITGTIKYYKTRNIPPAINQRWIWPGAKYTYWISSIYDSADGTKRVSVSVGSQSMGFSMEEWRKAVRKNHMYLVLPRTKK